MVRQIATINPNVWLAMFSCLHDIINPTTGAKTIPVNWMIPKEFKYVLTVKRRVKYIYTENVGFFYVMNLKLKLDILTITAPQRKLMPTR